MADQAAHPALPGASSTLRRAMLLGWLTFALVDILARLSVYEDPTVAIGISAVVVPLVLLLAWLLRLAFARLPAEGRATLPGILALAALASVVAVTTGHALRDAFGLALSLRGSVRATVATFLYYQLVFSAWGLVCVWLRAERARQAERRRAQHAESEALRIEIARLRQQLDPHFMLNALNGIGELIPDTPEAAGAMLRDLSVFLQQSLSGVGQPIVTVAAEAEALAAYLRVQQARFGARLRGAMAVAPEALALQLPSLLLQPLVENAVEHGRRATDPFVAVTIGVAGDGLEAVVRNAGGLDPAAVPRGGIGLDNVRRRLALHYPGRHDFTLEAAAGTVTARLLLRGAPCVAP